MICAICAKGAEDITSNVSKRIVLGWSKHNNDHVWWTTCGKNECKNAPDEIVLKLKDKPI